MSKQPIKQSVMMTKKEELDRRVEELKKKFIQKDIGTGLQNRFGTDIISDDIKESVNKSVSNLSKLDLVGLFTEKLKFLSENPEELRHMLDYHKCIRCGKEFYLPKPSNEELKYSNILSWTSFVKQYAKHKDWYELVNENGNLVCPDCFKKDDIPNNILLDSFYDNFEWYNQWRVKNNK